jgi:hypothetical protein
VVVVVLALAPDLLWPVREAVVHDVGEAAAVLDLAVIGDGENEGVAERQRPGGEDDQRIAVTGGAERRPPPVGDLRVLEQRPFVQDHRVEAGSQCDEGRHDTALEGRRVPVEFRHDDPLMDQVVVVRAGVMVVRHQRRIRLRERGPREEGRGEQDPSEAHREVPTAPLQSTPSSA